MCAALLYVCFVCVYATRWETPFVYAVQLSAPSAQHDALSLTALLLLPYTFYACADLQAMTDSQRAMELGWAGLGAASIEGVGLFLSAMPRLSLTVLCEVEGEEEVMEGDPVHCKVRRRGATDAGSARIQQQRAACVGC
jgi:hypothetical protein